MKLEELLRNTDALTYANALKVTITEIKDELTSIEEMTEYITQSVARVRKLTRKADNQYRVIAKLSQDEAGGLANNVSVEEDIDEQAKDLMEEV